MSLVLYRNGAQDESGEYYPTNSWSGEKVVLETHERRLDVTLKVSVWPGSLHGHGRVRPARFGASLVIGTYHHTVREGEKKRCSSLKDVVRQVDQWQIDAEVRACLVAYFKSSRRCVYRLEGGVWVPHQSLIADSWKADYREGQYLELRERHSWEENPGSIECCHVRVSGGTTSSWSDEWRAVAKTLDYWLPREEAAAQSAVAGEG